ncbi:MAG: CpsB/CapC family capsule biosynthesis tyrosine phosphatase [Rikenellaceae bacterium]
MFSIFSQKQYLLKSDLFHGFTDFHSHILPSVDDGIRCVDDALKVLSEYESLGIKRVVFTPHIMEAFPENNTEYLRSEFEKFKSIYDGSIELHLAAEYMLDLEFDEYLERGNMLTLMDNYLLVETSYMSPPMNFESTLNEIRSKGYFVVLAHPERYGYMREGELEQLKSDGVLFQLNLLSLSGYYGKRVKDRAIYLLDNDMYNIIGSDLHNLETFQKWISQITLKSKQFEKLQRIKEKVDRYLLNR